MSETAKLIEAVRANPLLYDSSHVDYKNVRKREEAWYNISEGFEGKYDVDWKKKWKNVKDSYVKYLKVMHLNAHKRNTALRRYKTWPWAIQMEFIRPFCKFNMPPDSNTPNKEWFDVQDGVNSEESLKGFPETDAFGDICEKQMDIKNFSHFHQTHDIHDLDAPENKEFNAAGIQHIYVDDSKDGGTSKATKRKRMCENTSTHNEIELILMGYAKTIKTLSPKRQTMVKFKFSQILMEAELEQLEEDQFNRNNCSAQMQFHKKEPSSSYDSSN